MSQNGDDDLQKILQTAETRRRAELQKAEGARQIAEAEAARRVAAAPKIKQLVELFDSTAALVNGELAGGGVRLEVHSEAVADDAVAVTVKARPHDPAYRVEKVDMTIGNTGHVQGGSWFVGQPGMNPSVDQFDAAQIRKGYLTLAKVALRI